MPSGWPPVPDGSPFPLSNLPYGVAAPAGGTPRVVVPVGEHALDLAALARAGLLDGTVPAPEATFDSPALDELLAAGSASWRSLRARLRELLDDPGARDRLDEVVLPLAALRPSLPFTVADFVDFYASIDHASNVGRILRPGGEPLTPNWRWQPLGYHGRAGTVIVSGTPITRPVGQWLSDGADRPVVGPTRKLDVEVEVACVVGTPSEPGQPVTTAAYAEHVFGLVLVNDWSARDIQAWETQPLGPFLGKSFATTISPWVVPLDALDAARVPSPRQDPQPATHLRVSGDWSYDLDLELLVNGTVASRPSFRSMYWTMPQLVAHATSNGAHLRTGDLFASGTVSGPQRDQRGCLLELSWDGAEPFGLDGGTTRSYLLDGDDVVIRASGPGAGGTRIGFGECSGTVLASLSRA